MVCGRSADGWLDTPEKSRLQIVTTQRKADSPQAKGLANYAAPPFSVGWPKKRDIPRLLIPLFLRNYRFDESEINCLFQLTGIAGG
jgi:hypothetical protein